MDVDIFKGNGRAMATRIEFDSFSVDHSTGRPSWYCEIEEETRQINLANAQKRSRDETRMSCDGLEKVTTEKDDDSTRIMAQLGWDEIISPLKDLD